MELISPSGFIYGTGSASEQITPLGSIVSTPATGGDTVSIAPLTGALRLAGSLATVRLTKRIAPTTGALAFNGGLGSVRLTKNIAPLAGTLAFNGEQITVESEYSGIGAPANIAFVDSTDATASWAFAHTSGGPGRYMFICTSARQPSGLSDRLCSAITFNADSATPVSQDNGSSVALFAGTNELWMLKDPDAGAGLSLARVFAEAPATGDVSSVVFDLTGLDDTDPIGTIVKGYVEDTSTPSISITTTTPNSMIVGVFARTSTNGITWNNGADAIYGGNVVNRVSGNLVVGYKRTTTVGEYTIGGATGGGGGIDWNLLAVELLPVVETGTNISPITGALRLNGGLGSVRLTKRVAPITGTLAFRGELGVVTTGIDISPTTGVLALNGGLGAVRLTRTIAPVTGALTFRGELGVVVAGRNISPLTGTLRFSGNTVDAEFGGGVRDISPLTGTLHLGGNAIDVELFLDVDISPQTGQLRFVGNVVPLGAPQAIEIAPETGVLFITGGVMSHSVFTWEPVPESDTLWTQAV